MDMSSPYELRGRNESHTKNSQTLRAWPREIKKVASGQLSAPSTERGPFAATAKQRDTVAFTQANCGLLPTTASSTPDHRSALDVPHPEADASLAPASSHSSAATLVKLSPLARLSSIARQLSTTASKMSTAPSLNVDASCVFCKIVKGERATLAGRAAARIVADTERSTGDIPSFKLHETDKTCALSR